MRKFLCLLSAISLLSIGEAAPQLPSGWIVSLSAKGQLEAHSAKGKTRKALRNLDVSYGRSWNQWDIGPDGKRIIFPSIPTDVDFFSAQSTRSYLFEQRFNEKNSRSLIVAYKYKAEKTKSLNLEGDDCAAANWDFQSRNLVVMHADSDGYTYPSVASLFNPLNNKFKSLLDTGNLDAKIRNRAQTEAVINRTNSKIVYVGVSAASRGNDSFFSETDWNSYLVVYDLVHKESKTLAVSPVRLSRPRMSPNGNSCVFVDWSRATEKDKPQGRIFQADLQTGVVEQLTKPQNETDNWPDWSPDGRFIVYQRENLAEKNPQKRFKLCLMKANGSGQKPIRFGYQNSGLRWIAALPNWSRFAKLPIEAKVSPTKK